MVFALGEWYHCFNRGVDKRNIFENESDADRFLILLYLANGIEPVQLFRLEKPTMKKALTENRGTQVVSVGAYCLMPNHYHLLLKEIVDDGISSFMRAVGTAYTMYFNKRNSRTGHLFSGAFQSRHVGTDRYFQRVLRYIHCNPAELYERSWKEGRVKNICLLEQKLLNYPYSSLKSFEHKMFMNPILSNDAMEIAERISLAAALKDAREYYATGMKDQNR